MNFEVLLVNYGGPKSIAEIPGFLKNLVGKEVSGPILQDIIDRYIAIGGGSPLCEITDSLSKLLLTISPQNVSIESAFRYSSPSIEERISQCSSSGKDAILFFVLSPFYSSRTVGSYVRVAETCLRRLNYHPKIRFIHSWYAEPTFIDSWVSKIGEEIPGGDCFLLFSAHSLPQALSKEPYKEQIEKTVTAVASKLRLTSNYGLAWQSVPRGVTEAWIGPSPEEVITSLPSEKISHIVEVPIGFLNDHLETLYDMDIAHRHFAISRGFQYTRISSFNTYPPFVETLKIILNKELARVLS
jgi:protoporphyrin/coproporphyrin ferrochelatase